MTCSKDPHDHNYFQPGYSYVHGINSVLKRCIYGKEGYKYSFEYIQLFWDVYKNKKIFQNYFRRY